MWWWRGSLTSSWGRDKAVVGVVKQRVLLLGSAGQVVNMHRWCGLLPECRMPRTACSAVMPACTQNKRGVEGVEVRQGAGT